MINIYLDCELTHLSTDDTDLPLLVSIGCVAEDGKIFYAENEDVHNERCNEWVVDNVLPLLEGANASMPLHLIASSLKDWLKTFNDEVQMLTDAPHIDWPQIQMIFDLYEWPCNLIRAPKWLWLADGVVDNLFVRHPDIRRHHALDDALINKIAHEMERNGTRYG